MIAAGPWITACVPTFACDGYLRHSVQSLLAQTYPQLRVIVINDGNPSPPWPMLADIHDPRLVRYDLGSNQGPYFCRAVAAAASDDPLLLVQDADDWSAPDHVAMLMNGLTREKAAYAFATQAQYAEDDASVLTFEKYVFAAGVAGPLDERLRYRAPHHGLFRRSALEAVGGFFAGFHFGYDLLLMNLIHLTGTIAWVPQALYHRRCRPGSLTTSGKTGYGTTARKAVDDSLSALYAEAYRAFLACRGDGRAAEAVLEHLRTSARRRIGAQAAGLIAGHAAALRQGLAAQTAQMNARPSGRW